MVECWLVMLGLLGLPMMMGALLTLLMGPKRRIINRKRTHRKFGLMALFAALTIASAIGASFESELALYIFLPSLLSLLTVIVVAAIPKQTD